MKITFIGDVHGKTPTYQKMLRQRFSDRNTIQVGDMGLGFKGVGLHKMTENHKFFRGNHDSPVKCKSHHNYLGDYGYLPEASLFYLAGAFSIDRVYRTEGISWWSDEELSWAELDAAIALYKEVKPRFVASHECPSRPAKDLLYGLMGDYFASKAECSMSRTAEALQVMLEAHEPEEWIFGHYHINKTFVVGKTTFRCLDELSSYELDTEKCNSTGD